MAKLRFGYAGRNITDLLGDDVLKYRDFLKGLEQRHPEVKLMARFSSSEVIRSQLNVSLEGELAELETVVDEVFEELGMPQCIDSPNETSGVGGAFLRLLGIRSGDFSKAAYDILRTRFKQAGIKLYGVIGGTEVVEEYRPVF